VFNAPEPDTVYEAMLDAVQAFYDTDTGEGTFHKLGTMLSPTLSRTVNPIARMYDITGHEDGSPFGSPVATRELPLLANAVAGGGFPNEVAIALSFRADYGVALEEDGGLRPRSRRRGRIRFGPVVQATGIDAGGGDVRVNAHAEGCLGQLALNLLDNEDVEWGVWSRKDAVVRPVVQAWIDNAFDTVRKRGLKSTSRSVVVP
jgi:hypothetical protein